MKATKQNKRFFDSGIVLGCYFGLTIAWIYFKPYSFNLFFYWMSPAVVFLLFKAMVFSIETIVPEDTRAEGIRGFFSIITILVFMGACFESLRFLSQIH